MHTALHTLYIYTIQCSVASSLIKLCLIILAVVERLNMANRVRLYYVHCTYTHRGRAVGTYICTRT